MLNLLQSQELRRSCREGRPGSRIEESRPILCVGLRAHLQSLSYQISSFPAVLDDQSQRINQTVQACMHSCLTLDSFELVRTYWADSTTLLQSPVPSRLFPLYNSSQLTTRWGLIFRCSGCSVYIVLSLNAKNYTSIALQPGCFLHFGSDRLRMMSSP
jgi:hypothetical protein